MTDTDYLQMAEQVAAESKEPVKCGCLLIANGEVIGKGFNSQRIDRIAVNHAEIKALVMANLRRNSRVLEDATAYCSCEPCAMCLAALSYAKVPRIIYNRSLKQLAPNDAQSNFDSQTFIKTLNYVPKLKQVLL